MVIIIIDAIRSLVESRPFLILRDLSLLILLLFGFGVRDKLNEHLRKFQCGCRLVLGRPMSQQFGKFKKTGIGV